MEPHLSSQIRTLTYIENEDHPVFGTLVEQILHLLNSRLVFSDILIHQNSPLMLRQPKGLVAVTDHDPVAKILYLGTMAVSSVILAFIAWVIRHDASVRDTDEAPDIWQSTGVAVGFLVALAVMLALPSTGYWPLLLLFLVDPAVRLLRRVWV